MDIWKAPNILRIDLKRFQSRAGIFFGQKLDKFVEYPVHDLDISEFVSGPVQEPLIYELYAVAVRNCFHFETFFFESCEFREFS